MKGKILDFSIQNSSGVISADDGKRYNFSASEWKSDTSPSVNQIVDFIINGENAIGIYLDSSSNGIDTDAIKDNILKNGIYNKAGFTVSLLLAFSFFLKSIDAGWLGSASFMNGFEGKILFLIVLGAAYLLFAGIQQKLLKILSIVITAGIGIKYFLVLMPLLNKGGGMLNIISIGTYVTIPLTIAFLIIGLKAAKKAM